MSDLSQLAATLVSESGATKTQLHLACLRDVSAELPAQAQTPTAEKNNP